MARTQARLQRIGAAAELQRRGLAAVARGWSDRGDQSRECLSLGGRGDQAQRHATVSSIPAESRVAGDGLAARSCDAG